MAEQQQPLPKVVLVGNPNVGKSVLFNVLTGAYTTVSNYPGTSVEVSRGQCEIAGTDYEILDTPGMYSIMPITEEERVARQILLQETPHAVLHVIDARNIERMLPMTLQLIEAGLPIILVVNILDEAKRLGMEIDLQKLQKNLGVPVIGTVMKRRQGLPELQQAISEYASVPHKTFTYGSDLERDVTRLATVIKGDYRFSKRATSLLLMQKDEDVEQLIVTGENTENLELLQTLVRDVIFERRADLHLQISMERKKICKQMLDGVVQQTELSEKEPFAELLSRWTVNPWSGVPILLLVVYFGLYKFVGGFGAGTLVDLLEGNIFEEYINPPVINFVQQHVSAEWLFELLVGEYGLWTLGIRYAVALVLPIVGTFFLMFSLLEDTGYFPRLALLVDRVFKKIGLSGRAVIPMVLGFGCDTMATMVTRTLETVRERIIATILLALAIPCSAQLGVILGLLSGVPGALAVWLLAMILVFLLVGLLAAKVMPGEHPIFYMELPPMRLPQLRNVLVKTLSRMQSYFMEILPLFLFASFILWSLKMLNVLEGLIGALSPVVRAIGLPVEATSAFVFGFFRRDFGAAGLYDLQTNGLLTPAQLTVAAVTLTLFVPCIAQFLMMKKERGLRVSVSIFVFVSLLAFSCGWVLNKILLTTGLLA
ncbi:ferrous iron transport protein B [Malonomonas rubra DSM 5091]|uniref:Ferrous iron transport protein B n=1 Tax=Malonomonas rubra DSM 5091 TaxID=1122189 RepID=A0A1M6BVW6_MALRU|nr:ferrous iron transport protein B [Malonomonas rubra]SHI52932.1 ferrous iron transport protein B [Malonomonas rubra DSM 5091]